MGIKNLSKFIIIHCNITSSFITCDQKTTKTATFRTTYDISLNEHQKKLSYKIDFDIRPCCETKTKFENKMAAKITTHDEN